MIKKLDLEQIGFTSLGLANTIGKINELIDYLSDKEEGRGRDCRETGYCSCPQHITLEGQATRMIKQEASKGECKAYEYDYECPKCHKILRLEIGAKDKPHSCNPPQQEESRGECKHCHMSLAIRNPSGYCDHLQYPSYCDHCNITADIFSKPQLKEESPKEDEVLNKLDSLWEDLEVRKYPAEAKEDLINFVREYFVSKEKIKNLATQIGMRSSADIVQLKTFNRLNIEHKIYKRILESLGLE